MNLSEHCAQQLRILNLAFYQFKPISVSELEPFKQELLTRVGGLSVKGNLILSPEGINGMLAGPAQDILAFKAALEGFFSDSPLEYKESWSREIPFRKLRIKIKREIVPFAVPGVEPARVPRAASIKPETLQSWYREGRDFQILDTRNTYEIVHGGFQSAKNLGLEHFRDFPERLAHAKDLKREKPLVLFCTGGVRCEKAALLAQKEEFKEIYQLEGGILNYFKRCGDSFYEGSCYVFDQRLVLTPKQVQFEPEVECTLT